MQKTRKAERQERTPLRGAVEHLSMSFWREGLVRSRKGTESCPGLAKNFKLSSDLTFGVEYPLHCRGAGFKSRWNQTNFSTELLTTPDTGWEQQCHLSSFSPLLSLLLFWRNVSPQFLVVSHAEGQLGVFCDLLNLTMWQYYQYS